MAGYVNSFKNVQECLLNEILLNLNLNEGCNKDMT